MIEHHFVVPRCRVADLNFALKSHNNALMMMATFVIVPFHALINLVLDNYSNDSINAQN
jgi:hypothetical protein